MTIDDITTIGVVGAGQMGRGITQVLATAGWNVLLVDVTEEALEDATKKSGRASRKPWKKVRCEVIRPDRPWRSSIRYGTCNGCGRRRS